MVGSGLVLDAGTHQELSDLLVADSQEAKKTQTVRTQAGSASSCTVNGTACDQSTVARDFRKRC